MEGRRCRLSRPLRECWTLLGRLFVGGVMNLPWVAAITAAVLAEKPPPRGGWIARATGAALILAGV